MNIDNTLYSGRPTDERSDVEMAIYDKLDALGIEYKRADHDHADTMEDCLAIEKVLGAKICKNLFLCNRQKTSFYMLLMPGDKPFKTKFLTSQLNCARLSFAEADKMQEPSSALATTGFNAVNPPGIRGAAPPTMTSAIIAAIVRFNALIKPLLFIIFNKTPV